MFVLKKANSLFQQFSSKEDRELANNFGRITGKQPINLGLYKQAVSHSSVAKKNRGGIKDSYERLEYLGDAILGMIVAEFLFTKYPFKEEGFLTELRARVVSRESLNLLCQKIGL
ncbi:MAG: ribonuclease III domain-containing protein, partial [Cyclobacteriaceae bacterium]